MKLRLELVAENSDEEVDYLASSLQRRISEIEDVDVERPAEAGPTGSKSAGGIADYAVLVVQLGEAGLSLGNCIAAVRAWLSQSTARSVRASIDDDEIELSHATAAQQDRIVDAWLAHHRPPES